MVMNKKNRILIVALVIIISAVAYYFLPAGNAKSTLLYGEASVGDINVIISSSGTLQALSTVEVGTQVSGKITRLLVDFNSEVKKGQLLAVLDTITLAAQLHDAEANLLKAKADLRQKKAVHESNISLYEKKYISELEYIQSATDFESASASLQAAESAVDRARTNLGYAYIYAPISGKIINRAIEQGQTVAANFSAPTLFAIAEDLSSMRIMTNVDESDIGQIKEGQNVTFTVQAYNDQVFTGVVSQMRLNATVVSNVVNYTVVILADNKERLLLPGMTATVDFYIESRKGTLLVPNTALRFKPDAALVAELAGTPGGPPPPNAALPTSTTAKNAEKSTATKGRIWYTDASGKLKMFFVTSGITDGRNTEIIEAGGLEKGMKVITGVESQSSATGVSASGKTINSLTGTNRQSDGPPPPPSF